MTFHLRRHDDVLEELNRMLDEEDPNAFLARAILELHHTTLDLLKGLQMIAKAGVYRIDPS